jgi:cytochrome b561
MRSNTVTDYAPIIKFIHWLIAIAIILMLPMGFFITSLPEVTYTIHKSVGLTVLVLMIVRIFLVIRLGTPALPTSVKKWERALSKVVQYGFYLLIILMSMSGWIASVAGGWTPSYFGLFNVPFPGIGVNKPLEHFMAESHEYLAWIIIIFITLHVVGALKHHFIDKDNVLKRMFASK